MFNFLRFAKTSTNSHYVPPANHFGAADWTIMVIYLVAVFLLGFLFYYINKRKKTTSTKNFFDGGGKTPGIVVGFSIYATGLSSLTYLATPALAFKTGWLWTAATITILLVTPVIIKWVIPFFRRVKDNTAYAYLGNRFHYSLRAISSASFILFHIFRVAIVLYIPTLAISLFIPNISPYVLVLILAAIVIFSTVIGGFRSVMWSDFVQGIVLIVGIVVLISFGLAKTLWNSPTLKYQAIFTGDQWKIGFVSGGMLFIFLSKYVESLFTYMGSQDIVQRYKANKDVRKTNQSLWVNFFLVILTVGLFFGAGSVLYTYYSSQGVDVNSDDAIQSIVNGVNGPPAIDNQLLPKFMVTVLPIGLSGLIISAIFAASQSTISSSLSALSNAVVVDFLQIIFKRYKDAKNDRELKWVSMGVILIAGVVGTGVAMLLIFVGQGNLIQYFLSVIGLLGGPIAALFVLGIFTKRANWVGALVGIIVAFIVGFGMWIPSQKFIPEENRLMFSVLYQALIPFCICAVLGYVISAFLSKYYPNRFRISSGPASGAWAVLNKYYPKTQISKVNMNIWETTAEFKQLIALEKRISKAKSWWNKKKENQLSLNQMVLEMEWLESQVREQMN